MIWHKNWLNLNVCMRNSIFSSFHENCMRVIIKRTSWMAIPTNSSFKMFESDNKSLICMFISREMNIYFKKSYKEKREIFKLIKPNIYLKESGVHRVTGRVRKHVNWGRLHMCNSMENNEESTSTLATSFTKTQSYFSSHFVLNTRLVRPKAFPTRLFFFLAQ